MASILYSESTHKKSALNIVMGMDFQGLLYAGIYSMAIYYIIFNFSSIKTRLSGFTNKWVVFGGLLFAVGYVKHKIGYYLYLNSAYCKQTDVCNELLNKQHKTVIDKLKAHAGLEESILFEAVGEGVIFALVGVPLFLVVKPHILAAFGTGIISHVFAEYSGIHAYFCKTSCGLVPEFNF